MFCCVAFSRSHRLCLLVWAALLLPGVGAQASLEFYNNARYFDRFNPPPKAFNTRAANVGFDSQKRDDWNALQFRGGAKVAQTPIYDNQGNPLTKKGKPVVTKACLLYTSPSPRDS